MDDTQFIERLRDMQLDEKEAILRDKVNVFKTNKLHFRNTDMEFKSLDARQRLYEAELHRVSQVNNRRRWSDAVRTVFGQEGYEAVLLELERMAGFPYR